MDTRERQTKSQPIPAQQNDRAEEKNFHFDFDAIAFSEQPPSRVLISDDEDDDKEVIK
jgi:hypothetical protein